MNWHKISPHYDYIEDKIKGCEHGSLVWHHENRHRWQHKNRIFTLIWNMNFWAMTIFIILSTIKIDFVYASLFVPIFFMTLIELDAWIHGYKNWKKGAKRK